MVHPLVFDGETRPQSSAKLAPLFEPPEKKEIKDFNPDDVKLGQMKDPEKIKNKIEGERAKHAKSVASADFDYDQNVKAAWSAFVDKAALDPVLGEVLCIQFFSKKRNNFLLAAVGEPMVNGGDEPQTATEADVLEFTWQTFAKAVNDGRRIVGLNIFDFDLPFMYCRSLANGVQVPRILLADRHGKWPKWNEHFVDLRRSWLCGRSWTNAKSSFNHLAHVFGTEGKMDGEVSGGEFWKYWDLGGEDRELAVEYARQDVVQPAEWAEAMGL